MKISSFMFSNLIHSNWKQVLAQSDWLAMLTIWIFNGRIRCRVLLLAGFLEWFSSSFSILVLRSAHLSIFSFNSFHLLSILNSQIIYYYIGFELYFLVVRFWFHLFFFSESLGSFPLASSHLSWAGCLSLLVKPEFYSLEVFSYNGWLKL